MYENRKMRLLKLFKEGGREDTEKDRGGEFNYDIA
jgi:hypothetical protein